MCPPIVGWTGLWHDYLKRLDKKQAKKVMIVKDSEYQNQLHMPTLGQSECLYFSTATDTGGILIEALLNFPLTESNNRLT